MMRVFRRLGLSNERIHVISAVNIGNVLEWFDVYSFAYLAPILSKLFFNFKSPAENMLFTFLLFGVGFISRPIGGIYFGRLGDKIGRKFAFIQSILFLTVPTFLMGFVPTYASWGIYAPLTLFVLRFIQSFSTGGEIPGTICFLYENADVSNRRFITSWNAFGNQIGAILGLIESYIMENIISAESMLKWGWRISFISGGLIGLFGLYLRHTLHETPVFCKLKKSHKIDKETVRELIVNFKKPIVIGVAFGAIDAAAFYLLATYIPSYLGDELGISFNTNLIVLGVILLFSTILLPIFGRLGDVFKEKNKHIFIISTVIIILLLYPIGIALKTRNIILLSALGFACLIPVTCITALIACLMAELFPASVRFTGLGISMNLADGIIGGFAPAIALIMVNYRHHEWAFNWYVLCCGLISLCAYIFFMSKSSLKR